MGSRRIRVALITGAPQPSENKMNQSKLNQSFTQARVDAWALLMAIRGHFSTSSDGDAEALEALALKSVHNLDELRDANAMVTVVLTSVGARLIEVIKQVRAFTGLGLKEAKELVEAAPIIVGQVPKAKAFAMMDALQSAGASVIVV
jgi:ribosomal protein L7/L12